jgi:hypothetical protein
MPHKVPKASTSVLLSHVIVAGVIALTFAHVNTALVAAIKILAVQVGTSIHSAFLGWWHVDVAVFYVVVQINTIKARG